MKNTLFLCLLFLVVPTLSLANQVEIVEIKGKVSYRVNASADWESAKVGLMLKKEAEIKTGFLGKCTIAFDSSRQNTVTINKNTHVAIEDIIPGAVFLSKGRVLTLIRDLKQVGDFEVRTPTAVTGARGTGWVTEFENGETLISVFEDDIFFQGIQEDGRRSDRMELLEDFRTSVSSNGQIQEIDVIPMREREKFQREMNQIEAFHSAAGMDHPPQGSDPMFKMIEELRQSGEYTEEEIRAMMDEMYHDGPMTVDRLIAELEMQSELGMITPEEQAMLDELYETQDSISQLSPQEQEQLLIEMGTEMGAYDPAMDGQYGNGGYMPGPEGSGTYIYDQETGEYYDQDGNLMEGMGQHYDPSMEGQYQDPNAGNYVYDEQSGQYYDQEGNLMEQPPQGGDFDQYMSDINGTGGEGMYQDPYAGDEYFGEFDQAWSGDGGYYVGDDFYYYEDDKNDAILDQQHEEDFLCPPPPPCLFDSGNPCPGNPMPPPGCTWPPQL